MHIHDMYQMEENEMIKRAINDIQKMTIEEQEEAVRSVYDMDSLLTDIVTYE